MGKIYGVITHGEITITLMEVTPEDASQWLDETNIHNRKLREIRYNGYSRDMTHDVWLFNGDPFRFAKSGAMLDGQHRAMAIKLSGKSQLAIVITGLPDVAQETMDIGAARTLADMLRLRGENDVAMLGSLLRRLVLFQAGHPAVVGSKYNPSKPEMLEFAEEYAEELKTALYAMNAVKLNRLPVTPAVIGAAYFLCAEVAGQDVADLFYVQQVAKGVNVGEEDPAWLLRQKFIREKTEVGQIDSDEAFRYTIQAWNHYRAGTKGLKKLQAPHGGWSATQKVVIK